jgi:hypothetical protein
MAQQGEEMIVMSFDLEDELPPVIFTLNIEDAERFESFMRECEQIKNAAQRTWVGLTLEEILETYRGPDGSDYVDYARGIEAKLKEKNT